MITEKQLRTYIYTLLTIALAWLLVTGRIYLYLHPRMVVFQVLALVFLGLITVYKWVGLIQDWKKTDEVIFKWRTAIPFLVLLMLIFMKPQTLSADVIQNKSFHVTPVQETVETREEKTPDEIVSEITRIDDFEEAETMDASVNQDLEEVLQPMPEAHEEPFQIATDFLGIMMGIVDYPEAYVGQEVTLEGFVYRDETFVESGLVVGRMMVTCCVADAYVTGLYIESDLGPSFLSDTWISVRGTIAYGQKYDPISDTTMDLLTLEDMTIEAIDPYDDPYIYWQY